MEGTYSLNWDEPMTVNQRDVICKIENDFTIIPTEGSAYSEVCEEEVSVPGSVPEVIVSESAGSGSNIMYLTQDNVLVMQAPLQESFLEVTEEVIAGDWSESQSEERVEVTVGDVGAEEQIDFDDQEIPLPTDQDPVTASRPFPCDFCSRRFRKKANLMNHMVSHQNDRPHECNLCGAKYIRKCDLLNHLKIHAYVPDPDELEEDDEELVAGLDSDSERNGKKKTIIKKKIKIKRSKSKNESESDGGAGVRTYDYVDEDMRLLNEMETQQQENKQPAEPRYPINDPRRPFVCQHCGVGFSREKALASHVRVHAGDSPFECDTCGTMFWELASFREHVRTKHAGVTLSGSFDDEDEDADYVDEEDNKYGDFYCGTCGVGFHRQDLLRRHARIHIKEELANESEFGHICNVCGESFPEALDLLAHAEVHTRSQTFRCHQCGECFTDEQALAVHVPERHAKTIPPNTCMVCGKTCRDRRTLVKHSWEHSREKEFTCTKCGKGFYNKARLKRHMVSHRDRAVQCDVCGEDFPNGRSLMNHRHSHSNSSGRQFPCRECGKTFGSRSSQQIHIRIHTGERPYGCRFCWKAFADGGTLRKHERIHTGEKPYACAVCPRAFNQRVVLREHIRSHHGGPDPRCADTMTPYCCAVCSDMFSASQDLITHLIHHCDLNTAMRRTPQVGPRKYKRRRKLKPHELEILNAHATTSTSHPSTAAVAAATNISAAAVAAAAAISTASDDDNFSDGNDRYRRRRPARRQTRKPSAGKSSIEEGYDSMLQSFESALQNINSIVNSKPAGGKVKKKPKIVGVPSEAQVAVSSRPKMIHTQKTRVPVEVADGGRSGKQKTKTLITRTTTEQTVRNHDRLARPRTKNVSYHVMNSDKYPAATFDSDDEEGAAKDDPLDLGAQDEVIAATEGLASILGDGVPDVAGEETVVETAAPAAGPVLPPPTRPATRSTTSTTNNQLKPGGHVIGPGNKILRINKFLRGGVLVSKAKPAVEKDLAAGETVIIIKEEVNSMSDSENSAQQPSVLHELAELSMQHAQNQFKCEMCSEVFSDRQQLLLHVPIHI